MFNVELSVSGVGGQAVVALSGELDLADASYVESQLIAAGAACGPTVIVDLTGLEFTDCCGLRALEHALKWIRQSGGDMFLVNPQQRVRRILEIAGVIEVFSVYPSVELALIGATSPRPLSVAS